MPTFALTFSTVESAERAAETLRAEGFDVSVSVDARLDAMTVEDVRRARNRMESIADQFDGEFLGNGSFGAS